jgi:hypothetical protein
MEGNMAGGGEYVQINGLTNWTDPGKLRVKSEIQPELEGSAYSFFAGVPDGYISRRSGLFEVSTAGTTFARMIPTRDGVCFLTKISGSFGSNRGAILDIHLGMVNGVEHWQIIASGHQAYGRAQCITYNQIPS